MSDESMLRRIDRMERRLERIEALLHMPAEPAATGLTTPRPMRPSAQTSVTWPARPETPPTAPPTEPQEALASQLVERFARTPAAPRVGRPAPESTASPAPIATPPLPSAPVAAGEGASIEASDEPATRDTPQRGNLELMVGGRWMAWIGAAAVVLAVSFFLKLAIDKGWVTPEMRCVLGALLGFGLLGAGELTMRKIGRLASTGLFASGLSILYLVSWATYGHYEIVSKELSFILMGVVAVGGFGLTLRTRFRTIGVLSMIGGYATPLLLGSGGGHDLELLGYLTMLLAISLALSATLPHVFRPLRALAFGLHAFVALLWLLGGGVNMTETALIFFSAWWSMVLVEATLAALREQSPVGNIVMTLVGTAAYVTVGTWLLGWAAAPAAAKWLGVFTFSVAAIGVAVAATFGPGLEALRGQMRSAMDKLAIALWAQSAVLLVVAIAHQFHEYGATIGWLGVGLASIEIARRLPSRGVGVFGLIVGGLGVGRLLTLDAANPALQRLLVDLTWLELNGWSALALAAIAAAIAGAFRLGLPSRGDERFRPWPVASSVLMGVALAGWLPVSSLVLDGLAITVAWLAVAVVLIALRRPGRCVHFFEMGLAVLACAAGRWLLVDALLGRMDRPVDSWWPLLNLEMAVAVAIAATGVWALWLVLRRTGDASAAAARPAAQWVMIGAGAFLLAAFSFQADQLARVTTLDATWTTEQVRQPLLTLVWSIGAGAIGLVAWTLGRRGIALPHVMQFTWLVLIVAAGKWLVLDTLALTVNAERSHVVAHTPLVNLQMLAGAVAAGAALLLMKLRDTRGETERPEWVGWVPVLASILVLWGLTFEVDRMLPNDSIWPAPQLRVLWWSMLWATGAGVMTTIGVVRRIAPMVVTGWGTALAVALVWLSIGSLTYRITAGVAEVTPVANLQFAAGLVVAAILAYAARRLHTLARAGGLPAPLAAPHVIVGLGLLGAVVLWMGSLEIDRAFVENEMAVQAGLSVYWSIFAVTLILIGFAARSARVRYVGLALLSIAAAKVLILDLANVDRIWRVVSFFVSGILLIATSVVYSKLAPRLLSPR